MGTCFITRKGAISKNYVYLDGNKYTIQKGSFPGVSANALPLDGHVNLSRSDKGTPWTAPEVSTSKNNVTLLYAYGKGSCSSQQVTVDLKASGYISFITAYGFSASALASADVSNVTVNYWLKKVS